MEQPLLLFDATHNTPVTGILIQMTKDEALNLQHALDLRSANALSPTRTITFVSQAFTRFSFAITELDEALKLVLRGTGDTSTAEDAQTK